MRSIAEIDRDHEGMGEACVRHSFGCTYPECECDRSKRIVPNVRGVGGPALDPAPDGSYAQCHGFGEAEFTSEEEVMPTTPQLPPLPEPYWVVPGVAHFCKDDPVYSASQLHARDRQIVELCASIASEFRRGAGDPVCGEVASAIRALLGDKGEA